MNLNILLSIAAIYMAIVGLGLIFAPQAFGVGAVPVDASAALILGRSAVMRTRQFQGQGRQSFCPIQNRER